MQSVKTNKIITDYPNIDDEELAHPITCTYCLYWMDECTNGIYHGLKEMQTDCQYAIFDINDMPGHRD